MPVEWGFKIVVGWFFILAVGAFGWEVFRWWWWHRK